MGSLTPQQQREMSSCFTQCLHNPCCQAVNITSCEWSGLKTEELDFVREVCMLDELKHAIYNSSSYVNNCNIHDMLEIGK